MVEHIRSLEHVRIKGAWLTIGSFDGVHLGHQAIIRGLTAGAHAVGAPAVVLTFHPHPKVVLRARQGSFYLTTPEERASLLGDLGVDIIITLPFTQQLASTSARDFIAKLKSHLEINQLWLGHDFALGRDREGDVDFLRKLGVEFEYDVHVVPTLELDGHVVSSSNIRETLLEGSVEQAMRLLDRPYQLAGTVTHGDGRGRAIGIPTANLETEDEKLVPGAGVYACRALVKNTQRIAATNIGVRPTFNGHVIVPQVEAHILDYEGDLYGQTVKLEFIERLRGEKRFPNIQALVTQINQDIQKARELVTSKVQS